MSGVVVDTSVWVEFFRGRSVPALEDALAAGTVVLSPLVVAELVSGALRPEERAAVAELLTELPLHETPLSHWLSVGALRRQLRGKGVSISTPDAHVAQCALDRGALLLSQDEVFTLVARHSRLRFSAVAVTAR